MSCSKKGIVYHTTETTTFIEAHLILPYHIQLYTIVVRVDLPVELHSDSSLTLRIPYEWETLICTVTE